MRQHGRRCQTQSCWFDKWAGHVRQWPHLEFDRHELPVFLGDSDGHSWYGSINQTFCRDHASVDPNPVQTTKYPGMLNFDATVEHRLPAVF